MNAANPLWGAPRIHGEILKLGIEISQATVAKYMVRRRGGPSPTWRSFLRNQAAGIAASDMFIVVSASFRLLYVMVILGHEPGRSCARLSPSIPARLGSHGNSPKHSRGTLLRAILWLSSLKKQDVGVPVCGGAAKLAAVLTGESPVGGGAQMPP